MYILTAISQRNKEKFNRWLMNNKRYLKMTEKVANRSEIKIKLIMHIVKIGMNQFDAGLLRWWETS